MIRAILFDFNGVIINDEPVHLNAYQEVLKEENINFTEEDYYNCSGMDDWSFVREQFKKSGSEVSAEQLNEIIARKTAAWRAVVDREMPLFGGLENFIKKCEKRFALAIVSMANRAEIEYVLERTALADNFTAIISAEDVSACKPSPKCFFDMPLFIQA